MNAWGRIGLFLFIAFQLPIVIFYFAFLIDKIRRPGFKNLNWSDFAWTGAAIAVLILIDVLFIKRVARGPERRKNG
jgi:hypothetical protein